MTTKYDKAYFTQFHGVPDNLLSAVMETPRLLPGERPEDYYSLFEGMICELIPDTDLQWFLTINSSWLLWEIQRFRRWKNAIILLNQRAALGDALLRTDPNHSAVGPTEMLRKTTQMKADALKGDPSNDPNVAKQLEDFGYDQDALNALAFLKGVPSLELIEKFLASAYQRLAKQLRDVAVRREFALRAKLLEQKVTSGRLELEAQRKASAKLNAAKK